MGNRLRVFHFTSDRVDSLKVDPRSFARIFNFLSYIIKSKLLDALADFAQQRVVTSKLLTQAELNLFLQVTIRHIPCLNTRPRAAFSLRPSPSRYSSVTAPFGMLCHPPF